jgi:hypothetical protein
LSLKKFITHQFDFVYVFWLTAVHFPPPVCVSLSCVCLYPDQFFFLLIPFLLVLVVTSVEWQVLTFFFEFVIYVSYFSVVRNCFLVFCFSKKNSVNFISCWKRQVTTVHYTTTSLLELSESWSLSSSLSLWLLSTFSFLFLFLFLFSSDFSLLVSLSLSLSLSLWSSFCRLSLAFLRKWNLCSVLKHLGSEMKNVKERENEC